MAGVFAFHPDLRCGLVSGFAPTSDGRTIVITG